MPIWLQLTAGVCAGIASAVMGTAFIPFMKKQRFCEEITQNSEGTAKHILLPTMGGVLAVFGCMLGFVLAYVLYCTVYAVDHTAVSVQESTQELLAVMGFALFWTILGVCADLHVVRRRPLKKQPMPLRIAFVYIVMLLFLMLCGTQNTVLDFGFHQYDAGILSIPFTAGIGTLIFILSQAQGEKTDGMNISVGSIVLLAMAVLLMQEEKNVHALLSLAAAGACMGCFVWNLHPAKCKVGKTGAYWVSAIITAVCLISRLHTAMLLVMAVCLLDWIPKLRKKGESLQEQMQQAGMKPWQSIAVFAGFACFCGIIAIMLYEAF